MNILDLINNHYSHYKNGLDSHVSSFELMEFVREYEEIKALKEKYEIDIENRKELSKELVARVNNILKLMEIFEYDLFSNREKYVFNSYISDYFFILYSLLKIANKDSNEYILKKAHVVDADNHDGNIWIIGKEDILNRIDDKKDMREDVFQQEITEAINNGYSIVMITNYPCSWKLLPKNKEKVEANTNYFKVNGPMRMFYCYTFDDELGLAVEKLDKYIEKYGGYINNMALDTLVSMIDNVDNDKKLIKNDYI